MANFAASTITPVATAQISTSARVTLGLARSVGGSLPVIFVHAVASTLRSTNTPPAVAMVVTSLALVPPSPFLPISSSYPPGDQVVPAPARGRHRTATL